MLFLYIPNKKIKGYASFLYPLLKMILNYYRIAFIKKQGAFL